MALIKDYEIQGTGVTVPDAYHVITDIKVHKRTAEVPLPPDSSTESGLTNDGVREEGSDVYWREGYVCRIWVSMWATKQARIDGLTPIGIAGENATEVEAELSIGTPGLDQKCVFMLDMDSTDSDLVQAYNHLKSLDYYAGCTED
tara:strand:+ start:852 stop:1286 length:435 start_codon:yes stop_codon:yes gene_type:complete